MSGDEESVALGLPAIIPNKKLNYIERRKGCKGAKDAGNCLSLSF